MRASRPGGRTPSGHPIRNGWHIALLLVSGVGCAVRAHAATGTRWHVRTSQGYDALCALNVLSGDDYYVKEYRNEARTFATPRYAGARREAQALKATLKDREGQIISAFLTLVFSGGPDSTLDAVIASARDTTRLRNSLHDSPYWGEDTWMLFQQVRPGVLRALEQMRDAGFVRDWQALIGEHAADSIASITAELSRFDVLGEQERLIGHPLQGGGIEVILLWYSRPHGIRIQGGRFLTNIDYPLRVVLRNAAHEPLHPPYDRSNPDVAAAVSQLASDSLVARIVREHDSSFGYTSADGYIEEDAVQALEQVVSERLGIATSPAARWSDSDDGMHLLAVALYEQMRETGFANQGGRFDRWFVETARDSRLTGREIERLARPVVGDSLVMRWATAHR